MDWLRLVSLLVYTFGIYAFGSMLLLWARESAGRSATVQSGAVAGQTHCATAMNLCVWLLFIQCVVWFVLQLLLTLFELNPAIDTDWFELARLVLGFLFPPLIMHITYLEVQAEERPLRHRLWPLAPWIMTVVCPLAAAYFVLAIFRVLPRPPLPLGPAIGISIGTAFAVVGLYCSLAFSIGRRQRETADQRSGRRSAVLLYVGLIVLVLLAIVAGFARLPVDQLLQLITGSMPLLFVFTSMHHESRFEFVDLFVKGGAFFLVAAVTLTACFALVLPFVDTAKLEWARPWVFAVLLLPLVMVLPSVQRRIGRWLDNAWLGRRLTPVEAIKAFLAGLGSACTEHELVEQAERELSAIFHAPVRIALELAEAPQGFEVALDVPVRRAEARIGAILLGRRPNHMPYFSEDIALVGSLGEVFAHMLDNVRLQERRQEQDKLAQELSLQASRSELKALRAQVNPHFLFNALNAIAGLIHRDPQRADQTVEQLAEIFRYTLRGSESEWAVLEQELDFARAYLEVERARFGERLQVRVAGGPEVAAARIPTMLLQTLVENAVKHGIAAVRGPARIEVEARRDGGHLVLDVADSGPGFAARAEGGPPARGARPRGEGYGLKNVRERLAGHFGEAAELCVRRDTERGMTIVSLVLPLDPAARPATTPDTRGAAQSSGAV